MGTHNIGKTALGGQVTGTLQSRGLESKFIGEYATKARDTGLKINEGTTFEAQYWILFSQFAEELRLNREREGHPNYDVLVCDRGPDNYCYLAENLKEDPLALSIVLGIMEKAPYSRLYLLPIVNSEISKGTGTRSENINFRTSMDQAVRSFLNKHDIPYIDLPAPIRGDSFREEWTRIIVNQTLEDFGMPKRLMIPDSRSLRGLFHSLARILVTGYRR